MCGVFAFVSHDGKGPDIGRLAAIARVTEARGHHAFGFAWIDSKGRLKMFKQTGRITSYPGVLNMARDARMLIGHCRWATQGDPRSNINNHPHPADGGWIVHNGMIHEYADLIRKHKLAPVSACDSEVLGGMVENLGGDLVERCRKAAAHVQSPLVLLGLWARPGRLIVVKAGNPLCVGMTLKGDQYYLGSLPEELPGEVLDLKNGVIEFTRDRIISDKSRAKKAVKPIKRAVAASSR